MTASGHVELLALQDLDVRLGQLHHRRNNHPLAAELRSILAEAVAQQSVVEEIDVRRHELERGQKRLDDEIATLDERRAEIEKRLYDGSVTASKDLLALQAESAHLAERKRGIEDLELEIMEELEPVLAQASGAAVVAERIDERRSAKEAELGAALGGVQEELTALELQRAAAAEAIDTELLATYESLRVNFGGVAVARLVGTTCGGCHLSMSAVDADRIRRQPADAVVRCPECNRLLVR